MKHCVTLRLRDRIVRRLEARDAQDGAEDLVAEKLILGSDICGLLPVVRHLSDD